MPVIAPKVHLNGSGKKNLVSHLSAAAETLYKAQREVMLTAPHMRDYYILPGGGTAEYDQALLEHYSRLARINSVIEELGEMVTNIENQ